MRHLDGGLAGLSTGELVEMAEAVAAELAVRAAPESGTAAMEWAERLGRSIDLFEAGLAGLVGRVDASGAHQQAGFPSAVSWLRERLGMRHGRASERVMLARQLPRLLRTAKLLAAGGLSVGYASVICDAVLRLDDTDTAEAEDILLGMVRDGSSVQQVGKAADRITDLIRQRQGKDREPEDSRRGFARSWLQRAKSLDGGSWLKGWLTPEHAAAFDQIVGALAKPRAQGDDRDLAQRTADAMMSVLTEGNKGAGVTVIIDLAAYTTSTGDSGPFAYSARHGHETGAAGDAGPFAYSACRGDKAAATGDPGPVASSARCADEAAATADPGPFTDSACRGDEAAATGDPGSFTNNARRGEGERRMAARLLEGSRISARDARRIALSGGINALILGRDGLPLYLGRTVRFATPAQRKVLLALYDTCVVEGCQIPAHLCEIHHLDGGWKLGTATDVHKLVPACGWHNRWIEDNQDRITQTGDTHGRIVLTIRQPWTGRDRPVPRQGTRRKAGNSQEHHDDTRAP